MVKKLLGILLVCLVVAGANVTEAAGKTTVEKFRSSTINVVTIKDAVNLLAEPNANSLVIDTVPLGGAFVPINQTHNKEENKVYNLVVRSDGAVGWIDADLLKIVPKKM